MRAKLTDKNVCRFCFGTGTELIKMGRFVYGRACHHNEQLQLECWDESGPALTQTQVEWLRKKLKETNDKKSKVRS